MNPYTPVDPPSAWDWTCPECDLDFPSHSDHHCTPEEGQRWRWLFDHEPEEGGGPSPAAVITIDQGRGMTDPDLVSLTRAIEAWAVAQLGVQPSDLSTSISNTTLTSLEA